MTNTYQKQDKTRLSTHFAALNFDCHCNRPSCKTTLIDEELIAALEQLWNLSGGFVIDSAYRCMDHNAEVGGAPDSQHLLGKAADCRSVKSYNGNLMARYAEQVPRFFKGGIGIYNRFTHCDVRQGKARWAQPMKC